MIRIAVLGDIGSGKSYVAKNFGYPVFNADHEVSKLYQKNRNVSVIDPIVEEVSGATNHLFFLRESNI